MTRDARHSTSDVVTVFARHGIAISTIARAMALPVDRVEGMCLRAHGNGELQMMPPATPDDPRHALLSELTNLRAQLDDAQMQIRELTSVRELGVETYVGVAQMTRKEAVVAAAIVKYGHASKSSIYHALYGGLDIDEQREPKIVDVFVCKIRKKLRPFGVEIDTQWGVGYKMSPENVARLRELADLTTLTTIDVPRMESPSLVPTHAEAYP
jgi:two-component system cell cycle response regulator CtrA